MERDRRYGGDDPSEIGHKGARRGTSERHRPHGGLDDAAALGRQVREGWSRVPADDGRDLPRRIVEAGLVPTQGPSAAVECFDEVTTVLIPRRRGQPRRSLHPPRAVGRDELARAVAVLDGDLHDDSRLRCGTALARPGPVVERTDGVRHAAAKRQGDVRGQVVAVVRIGERRPLGHTRAVDPQLGLLRCRHVRDGPIDGGGLQGEVGARERVLLGFACRRAANPRRSPVRVPQTRVEPNRSREGTRPSTGIPDTHRPPVAGVAQQSRAAIRNECLLS